MLRKMGMLAVLSLMVTALAAVPALAVIAKPHFVRVSPTVDSKTGSLVVSFKEAGLGAYESIDYVATASSTAAYQCWNTGGHHPQAGNKEYFSDFVGAKETLTSSQNGTISASLRLGSPSPGAFSCSQGQRLYLEDVVYKDVSLKDLTHELPADIPSGVAYEGEALHILVQ